MPLYPPDHPDRNVLAAEVHARPAEALTSPERASTITVLIERQDRERELAHVSALCERHGVTPPVRDTIHFGWHRQAACCRRVEIAREQHNQALLASMERRARLQLRLQQTVEGPVGCRGELLRRQPRRVCG